MPYDGGVCFSVASEHATKIEVILFDEAGEREIARRPLERVGQGIHSARIDGVRPGVRYGLRASGPFDPKHGLCFDPAKLLVDPYALTIDRPYVYDPRLARLGEDTADLVPKGIVTMLPEPPATRTPKFQPGGLIYEVPVKAFTRLHPEVPESERGTIAALAHPAVIAHFKKLGVAAVELMPVAAWIDERHLPPLGLTNAWGYNPVTFLALDPRLAPGGLHELRTTVEMLHAEGIDVFLDVVFNHTGESDEQGPTLSLRGLDHSVYYRHAADGRLVNDTGTGNTVACDRPIVRRMILDAMRHFARYAGIDGFRFDLAPILGRDGNGFSPGAALFREIAADPILSGRIMIAEPWDIGPCGYQLGKFPEPFLEWNDRYRDDIRRFWRGDGDMLGALATRLAGSSDVFRLNGEGSSRSVNFIAAHDGFTLRDVVSYAHKHNEANGEKNGDGHNDNFSWNNGAEGTTNDPSIIAARRSALKALLATLFSSRGTIMLTAGDEFGRTQKGNNNAYAQDNPLTWLDWETRDKELERHAALWSSFRRRFPALGSPDFLDGEPLSPEDTHPDVHWMHPSGHPMSASDWHDPEGSAIAMVLDAEPGENTVPRRIAVLVNRGRKSVAFTMPLAPDHTWIRADIENAPDHQIITVEAMSVALALEYPQQH